MLRLERGKCPVPFFNMAPDHQVPVIILNKFPRGKLYFIIITLGSESIIPWGFQDPVQLLVPFRMHLFRQMGKYGKAIDDIKISVRVRQAGCQGILTEMDARKIF